MRKLRFIAILLVSILLFSSVVPPATAQSDDHILLDRILVAIFKNTQTFGIPWFMFRFADPPRFSAEPNSIEVEYLNKTEIIIGMKNETTGEYVKSKDLPVPPLFEGMDYTFELGMPDYLPEDAFIARFSPQSIIQGEGEGEMKTKLILTSNIPRDAALPSEILLQIKVMRWTTAGNLYLPPKGQRWPFMLKSLGWFLAATGVTSPHAFGTLYSGKRTTDETEISYIDILVRVNRYHLAEITPPQHMEIEPNELLSIPIQIQNLGSHVDTFNFNVSTNTGSQLKISQPPAITLAPNEVGHTMISVASPLSFQDPGTTHSIYIEAHSVYEPEKVFANTVILTTRGVYLSEMNAMYSAFIGILILLAVGLFLYRRRRLFNKICQKPDKPWEIPEEKKHLEQLKKTDKEEYNNVLNMMGDEYKSSLLWYKDYCKAMLDKACQKKKLTDVFSGIKSGLSNVTKWVVHIFKRPVKKVGKPVKTEPKKPLKKEIKEAQKMEEVQPTKITEEEQKPTVDLATEREKRRREQAILKIKRAQEKQRRKFKKPAY